MKRILQLIFTMLLSLPLMSQDCTELFFSEYVEGTSQNKAIEIYNPTSNTIDLSTYKVERYSNGATNSSGGGTTTLSGMLASGDVFVLTHGDTSTSGQFGFIDLALYNLGDMSSGPYPSPMHMNGNDAMVLTNDGVIVDVIGRVGEDPGGAWTDDASVGFTDANGGAWWTANHTLIRKRTVIIGDNDGLDLFNPSIEWDSLSVDTWSNLGSHICDCLDGSVSVNNINDISHVIYPNPANIGDVVTISANDKIKSIEVFNSLGEKILSTKSSRFNTSLLSKGSYIAHINLRNSQILKKSIILY